MDDDTKTEDHKAAVSWLSWSEVRLRDIDDEVELQRLWQAVTNRINEVKGYCG